MSTLNSGFCSSTWLGVLLFPSPGLDGSPSQSYLLPLPRIFCQVGQSVCRYPTALDCEQSFVIPQLHRVTGKVIIQMQSTLRYGHTPGWREVKREASCPRTQHSDPYKSADTTPISFRGSFFFPLPDSFWSFCYICQTFTVDRIRRRQLLPCSSSTLLLSSSVSPSTPRYAISCAVSPYPPVFGAGLAELIAGYRTGLLLIFKHICFKPARV